MLAGPIGEIGTLVAEVVQFPSSLLQAITKFLLARCVAKTATSGESSQLGFVRPCSRHPMATDNQGRQEAPFHNRCRINPSRAISRDRGC